MAALKSSVCHGGGGSRDPRLSDDCLRAFLQGGAGPARESYGSRHVPEPCCWFPPVTLLTSFFQGPDSSENRMNFFASAADTVTSMTFWAPTIFPCSSCSGIDTTLMVLRSSARRMCFRKILGLNNTLFFDMCITVRGSSLTAAPSTTMIVLALPRTPATSFIPLISLVKWTCVLPPVVPPANNPFWKILVTCSLYVPWNRMSGILVSPTSSKRSKRWSMSICLEARLECPC